MSDTFHTTVDVREIPPRERHPLIFSTFEKMPNGKAFQLVNDHDPKPLFYQFQAEFPGRFEWQYLEQGPDTWRVRVGKVSTECCGSCGGSGH